MEIQLIALTVTQVEEVISLAENKAAAVSRGNPLHPPDFSMSSPNFREWQRLISWIDHLPAATRVELMALTWLGQGRIGNHLSHWTELLHAAERELRKDLSFELAMKPNLHKFLRQGLKTITETVD